MAKARADLLDVAAANRELDQLLAAGTLILFANAERDALQKCETGHAMMEAAMVAWCEMIRAAVSPASAVESVRADLSNMFGRGLFR